MPRYKMMNNVKVQFTAEEEAERDAQEKAWNDKKGKRKLAEIKEIRLEKLIETDYLANSDMTMPDNIKTWRQSLRDIPQNNTTEEQYDTLLERKDDGSLKHTIWEKP